MFAPDCDLLFREMRRVLRTDGALHFSVWSSEAENLWSSAVTDILVEAHGLERPGPTSPNAFRLGDPDEVRALLESAGFLDISFAKVSHPWFAQMSADEAFDALLLFGGPTKTLFERTPEGAQPALRQRIVKALAGSDRTGVSHVWSARAPG
jgi:hypothetical protein